MAPAQQSAISNQQSAIRGHSWLPLGNPITAVPAQSHSNLTAARTPYQARASAQAVASRVFRSALWQHVDVPAPSANDLSFMVSTRQPSLALAATAMVRTLYLLLRATSTTPPTDDVTDETDGEVTADEATASADPPTPAAGSAAAPVGTAAAEKVRQL